MHTLMFFSYVDLDFRPSDKDYHYCCPICHETSVDLKSVFEHRRLVHRISRKVAIKHLELEPDIHDPNNYCRCCERGFESLEKYRSHLKLVHFMRLKPLRIAQRHDSASKSSDSEMYRNSSKKFYNLQNYYLQKPDSSKIHCRACDKSLPSEISFQHHLLSVHSIDQKIPEESSVPEIDAVDNFCRVCKLQSASDAAYRRHLRLKHKMILQPLWKTLYDPKLLPDPLDPSFYCRVCELTNKTSLEYRKHCMSKHRMALAPVTPFAFPEAVINPDSPDLFCAKCNKHLKSFITFRAHLKRVHQIA